MANPNFKAAVMPLVLVGLPLVNSIIYSSFDMSETAVKFSNTIIVGMITAAYIIVTQLRMRGP